MESDLKKEHVICLALVMAMNDQRNSCLASASRDPTQGQGQLRVGKNL